MYPIVKHFHVILVVSSIALFQFRFWRYQITRHTTPKLMKILPHSIDTLLLISGVFLAVWVGFSPLYADWLLYKLLALLAYIIFGFLAMKKAGFMRWLGYVLATLAVIYMVMVATQKTTWPKFYLS